MKSGIYRTPNGNLILVRKDRTIAATNLKPTSWIGRKVSHRSADDTVLIEGTDYRCTRWADLRNGENRPADVVLAEAIEKGRETIAEFFGPDDGKPSEITQQAEDMKRQEDPLDAEVASLGHADSDDELRQQFKRDGFRFCHSQSARKHRRAGHVVRYVPELRQYAWAAR